MTEIAASKLLIIQQKLKAPKNQYNSFGKYKYRNCEDILEALKPLLKETETTLTITDDIVHIIARYYIKATASLWGSDGVLIAAVSAYAREEDTKKGMDGSQITGAASSYARKYALNGLFAIDDTKDADSAHRPAEPSSEPPAVSTTAKQNPTTTRERVAENIMAPFRQYEDVQNAAPAADHDKRVDIGNMLLQMCGTTEEAAAMLQILTSFTNKEGKHIKGRDSVKALSEKQVPVVYRKVKEQFEKWQQVQETPPGHEGPDDIELEDDVGY